MLLALALAALAHTAEFNSVTALKMRYVSSVERAQKDAALDALAVTPPRDSGDISSLHDLFARFPDARARKAALDSLELSPVHPGLESMAVTLLRASEPESVFFGTHLARKAGTPVSFGELRKAAAKPLGLARAEDGTLASERGLWWARYEALEQLALVDGAKALPLLWKRSAESPLVAGIIGRKLWKDAWPRLAVMAGSKKEDERAAAREAARQPIEPADARATRAGMLAVIPDAALDDEFRHQVALKVGASSTDAEAEELDRRRVAAKTDGEKLLWTAALFASNRPAAASALVEFAAESDDEARRNGALEQLVRLVGADKASSLVKAKKEAKK